MFDFENLKGKPKWKRVLFFISIALVELFYVALFFTVAFLEEEKIVSLVDVFLGTIVAVLTTVSFVRDFKRWL